MFGKYQKNALVPLDDVQLYLSEKFVSPNVEVFEKAFYNLRVVIDDLWVMGDSAHFSDEEKSYLRDLVHIQKRKAGRSLNAYPVGKCYNITKIAFAFVNKFGFNDVNSPFFPLAEFVREGGVFKVIWGEVRHEFFQTSMQIGKWCFDCANDTVFVEKPKVIKFAFDSPNNEFHDVTSLQQYIDVKCAYHKCDIYFNSLFPGVSPLFPLLIVKGDKVLIDDSKHIADLMASTNTSFLDDNNLPELPINVIEQIREKVLQNTSTSSVLPYLFEVPKELNESYAKNAFKAVMQINFILKFK